MSDEKREELIRQQRENEKKAKLAKIEIAKTRELYFNRIKTETLKSFKDVPDEVKNMSILKVTNRTVLVDWSAPENNGSEITEYRIHISKKMISDLGSAGMTIEGKLDDITLHGTSNESKYEFTELPGNSVFYVFITACNKHGEGYKSQTPFFIRTMPDSIMDTSSLYVWGSNDNSDLGLTAELVESNKDFYHKTKKHAFASKPIFQSAFGSIVHQVSCGNISTGVLCVTPETHETMLVMVGTTTVVREQFEGQGIDEKNYMTHSDIDMLQDIPSMPFQIEFKLPVAKVACGDTNYALLSCSGQVFTWGNNRYSQLGIDNSEIVMQMRPDETRPLEFKSESSSRSQHIIDIEASYGSFIALSGEQ